MTRCDTPTCRKRTKHFNLNTRKYICRECQEAQRLFAVVADERRGTTFVHAPWVSIKEIDPRD